MNASKTPSDTRELSAAEAGRRERNLAHLLIIAHDHGVPAAIKEWERMMAEKRKREALSSPSATPSDSADSPTTT
jgi:hypothetical protein